MKPRLSQKDICQIVTGGEIHILIKNCSEARVTLMLNLKNRQFWVRRPYIGGQNRPVFSSPEPKAHKVSL